MVPPLYKQPKPVEATGPAVPEVNVVLTPDLIRHYWGFFAMLRERHIVGDEAGAAMECAKRMDWLLDQL